MDTGVIEMVRKPPFTIVKTTRLVPGAGIDFAEAIRDGTFEGLIGDVKSGRIKRAGATDSETRNLKAKINDTGHVAYVIQYSAPPKPDDLPEEIHWVDRPMRTIGYYHEGDTVSSRLEMLKIVRRRVEDCNYLIEEKLYDLQLYGLGTTRFMAEIDAKRKDWEPTGPVHWWRKS